MQKAVRRRKAIKNRQLLFEEFLTGLRGEAIICRCEWARRVKEIAQRAESTILSTQDSGEPGVTKAIT